MTEKIPVFKPLVEQEEIAAACAALELGWLGMGSYVGEFEHKLQEYLGAADRFVSAVSTGHAALHLAMLLLNIGPGDEVITPAFNNAADFQAIIAAGAEPVFCDIENNSLCIDIKKAEALVSARTKAMIVMDYDCILCDHDGIAEFSAKHGIRIIHDAAHSFGSKYKGKKVGSFSDITMFSFDPVKTITCIDGGALIVRTESEHRKIQEMRLIGMTQPPSLMYQNQRAWTYDICNLGFRYHMANLHAAIGLSQLAKLENIAAGRQFACKYYNEKLTSLNDVRVPKTDFADVIPFLYYILVPHSKRDSLRTYLRNRGIDTGIHWQPGHWFSLFKNCRRGDLTVTESIANEILSLPLHSNMSKSTLDIVINSICDFFGGIHD